MWFMRRSVLDKSQSLHAPTGSEFTGITGAWNLMVELKAAGVCCGWTTEVCVQHVGHKSGAHTDHIKSKAHYDYTTEIKRGVKWRP